MNIFKKIGKQIQKIGKGVAPVLVEALNVGSPTASGLISKALGIGGAGPEVLLDHLIKTPPSPEQLIEIEKNNVEVLKAIVQDRMDARNMGIELAKTDSILNRNIVPIIAIAVMIVYSVIIYIVISQKFIAENKDLVMMVITGISAQVGSVLGYYFGYHEKNNKQAPLN